jgi:hypothetical protein
MRFKTKKTKKKFGSLPCPVNGGSLYIRSIGELPDYTETVGLTVTVMRISKPSLLGSLFKFHFVFLFSAGCQVWSAGTWSPCDAI